MNTNLTLSVDKSLVEKARAAASRQGTSLQDLIRDFIAKLAGERSGDELVEELRKGWKRSDEFLKAHPPAAGRRNDRDEIYRERLSGYGRSR